MNTRWTAPLVAVTAVIFGGALLAHAATAASTPNQSPHGNLHSIQVSTLIGAKVSSLKGQENLGTIKDLLLDPQTGQATFAILDPPVAGSGHGMLVVPYTALTMERNAIGGRPSVALDLRTSNLRDAPQIHANDRELLQNPRFLEQANNFYRAQPYIVARPIEAAPNTATSAPPALPQTSMAPAPCLIPQVQESDLPPDLQGFYDE